MGSVGGSILDIKKILNLNLMNLKIKFLVFIKYIY